MQMKGVEIGGGGGVGGGGGGVLVFFFQAEDGIRDWSVTGVQTCALPISAGVSVQTILRAFGSKDGLLVKTLEYEAPAALDFSVYSNIKIEDLDQLVTTLFKIYEKIGDLVIHALAHEHRSPEFQKSLDVGRDFHKALVSGAFGIYIHRRPLSERSVLFHALLTATDIYMWKILRRDEVLSFDASVATVVLTLKSLIQEKE